MMTPDDTSTGTNSGKSRKARAEAARIIDFMLIFASYEWNESWTTRS